MSVHLILGGARSGKSSHAERVAKAHYLESQYINKSLHYIATAQAFDDEMTARIKHHKEQRGDQWEEHEVPLALASALKEFGSSDVVLIDCLTLWLNNVIYHLGDNVTDEQIQQHITVLVDALAKTEATVLLVSNEVGLGVVPLGEVSRLFVDHAGWMNQKIATIASKVELIAAGLPLQLKS
ncbi:bifunctional adenosylcobinamide kinase/adenosylcobinamide-phosphate guanylyltransferase [Vibrio sp. ZSDE26]|uniref:Bifunctional adenosylcobalamin biosynthesis protein n=1 Tax=Vibrio amylolyticus TaxID=2847292 RepID=A0A9X1XMB2_9VIBR|nr:bifunctional adenosylcobinamide kinase/adenosylcobinamide-phosphate guanylyltransferase [Vibrio amylolyticus]MCK6264930.1 bifunctional adenosylcobinamide kinase/adenosylcobinamide-phosphate guanylyltransferase [Vibrio amylolyticus]